MARTLELASQPPAIEGETAQAEVAATLHVETRAEQIDKKRGSAVVIIRSRNQRSPEPADSDQVDVRRSGRFVTCSDKEWPGPAARFGHVCDCHMDDLVSLSAFLFDSKHQQ